MVCMFISVTPLSVTAKYKESAMEFGALLPDLKVLLDLDKQEKMDM